MNALRVVNTLYFDKPCSLGMQNDHIFRLLTKLCYWSQHLSIAPVPVEISTGRSRPLLEIFFLKEVHRHAICLNPARWSWEMLQTLRSTQKQVPGMHLTTIPKIVLVPRKSHFP